MMRLHKGIIKQAVVQDTQIFCPVKGSQKGGLRRRVQKKNAILQRSLVLHRLWVPCEAVKADYFSV